jgi:hypothetical protein
VVYRSLGGIATFVGAIALAVCFSTFQSGEPFGFAELGAHVQSIAGGMTDGSIGALLLLFVLYGLALAIIGYIASPAVLTLEEMASGCRPEPRTPSLPRRLESASANPRCHAVAHAGRHFAAGGG